MGLAPGTRIDRYLVEDVLGEGGLAVVYKVRHESLGSVHALKVLTVASPELKERLQQEGRIQAQLRHTNVVAVTDVVQWGDQPVLVLEFVEGPNLEAFIAERRPSIQQADALARGILDGVVAAHARQLIHRDLKPNNVLLQQEGDRYIPKIADFGFAKWLQEGHAPGRTLPGSQGTPEFMSPEQVRDASSVDQQTDVWALGALLYELVTGERAFGGLDMFDTFDRVVHGRFVPPKERVPNLPDRMDRAIRGALAVDRGERVPSVEVLRDIWSGKHTGPWDGRPAEPAAAPPAPPAPRAAPAGGQRTAVVGGVVIAAIGLAVGFFWLGRPPDPAAPASPLAEATAPEPTAAAPTPVPADAPADGADPLEPTDATDADPPAPGDPPQPGPARPAGPRARKPTADNPWGVAGPTEAAQPAPASRGDLAGTPTERIAALEAMQNDANATGRIGDALKTDADPSVRKRAAKLLDERWSRGVGAANEHEGLLKWAAQNAAAEVRVVACEALGARGSSVSDLEAALQHPSPAVRRAAVTAISAIAARTGQREPARVLLQAQRNREADPKLQKRLDEALASR
jgi:hypothetical protein